MRTKFVEIRDRATCIPALAIKPEHDGPCERAFWWRTGFEPGTGAVVLLRLADQRASSDPHGWGGCRTMTAAHLHVEREFDLLVNGQVVDARVVLGEAEHPAPPEVFRGSGGRPVWVVAQDGRVGALTDDGLVQFGPAGPFERHSPWTLRTATREEVERAMGSQPG